MRLLNLVTSGCAAVLALSLASCSTSPAMQGTQYMDAFGPPPGPQTPANYTGIVDTVSYWDGDNLSGAPSVTLDISDQKAYFYKGGTLAGVSMICTGDENHPTQVGNFKITQKNKYHKSNLYGDFVDSGGNIVVPNVDSSDKAPPGLRFEGSKMTNFMRFNGGAGMHEGFMAGYPASHGCVRMPSRMSEIFFNNVSTGTPVRVQY